MIDYIETLPLREHLITEKIISNLETGDGKWRSFFAATRGIDNKYIEITGRMLKELICRGIIGYRVQRVDVPTRYGRVQPMIDLPEYRYIPYD